VEVKIGVQYATRELVLESAQSPAEVEKLVTDALSDERNVLSLQDEKGRRVVVPVAKVAYVEIAESSNRPFGFTTGRSGGVTRVARGHRPRIIRGRRAVTAQPRIQRPVPQVTSRSPLGRLTIAAA